MTVRSLALLLALLAASCGGPDAPPQPLEAAGPPTVRVDVVARHAEQFASDLAERPAGSETELAASSYILAHLQEAGYAVRLDHVPVGNLVRSTNVVALPPSAEDPTTIVVVAYDTPARASDDDEADDGVALGLFLEIARALRAAEPDHGIEFVALGAERTQTRGGLLGSRRLARQALDEDLSVTFVAIDRVSEDARLRCCDGGKPHRVFARAGFRSSVVSGPPEELGRTLLEWLEDRED